MMMYAVSDDLGIGFGGEGVTQTLKIGAQHLVIFNDAVVHDRDAVAGYVRVRVVDGGDPMGRPPGVRNPDVPGDGGRVQGVLQNLDLADGAQAGDPAAFDYGDTRGVIAAVFQAPQTLHEYRYRVALRNHTHDSTHNACSVTRSEEHTSELQ